FAIDDDGVANSGIDIIINETEQKRTTTTLVLPPLFRSAFDLLSLASLFRLTSKTIAATTISSTATATATPTINPCFCFCFLRVCYFVLCLIIHNIFVLFTNAGRCCHHCHHTGVDLHF